MEQESQHNEISFIDFFAVLCRRKIMIVVITLIAIIGVIGFSVVSLLLPSEKSPLPNIYSPEALMLINDSSSSGGSLASMLGASGLGSLASLAGVSSGSSFSALAVYLVKTNTFLDAVVDEFNLIERYKINESPRSGSRINLKKALKAEYDGSSGVFSIKFSDTDPLFAQSVVNFSVNYLDAWFNDLGIDKNRLEKENLEKNIENTFREIQNLEMESHRLEQSVYNPSSQRTIPAITLEQNRIALELGAQQQVYSQLKVQYELLKVNMASEKPIFQILEMAEVPDQKSGPGRGMICIIVTFAAGFFSIFLAFVLNAIENIKKDPEAMAKLKGKRL